MASPSRVAFSQHALEQITRRGVSAAQAADAVLEDHDRRTRNPGSADWLLRVRGIVVAYNWPDGDDDTSAYVVSVWRE